MARQTFGKYEVLARLATGGAASIFLARQPGAAGFNKLVCLKTLLPERASDQDFVRMFLDEARLAARLHHPNCVQIYDLGRVDDVYYISMEYIFGETLWNLLTTVTRLKTPLPPTHVAAIIANVCEGLHHAHELKDKTGRALNLVHRDVSPQNVMVSFEGQTKVVDFGIAKAETDRPPTVAGIVKGKFSYMSPEQITGNPVDRRSDIYSLGIVMFECLASRRLYRGDSPEEIARLILEHRAPRLRDVVPDVPHPLDDICARALARQPHRRFQSAQAMGAAIREYLESVRFATSATVISRLMADRFGDVVTRRRRAYEAALTGDYDESFLCEALGAKPVRRIDLFAEDPEPHTESIAEEISDHKAIKPAEAARTIPHVDAGQNGRRHGPGWQVELSTSGPVDSPVSVMMVDALDSSPAASVRTRLTPSPPEYFADTSELSEAGAVDARTRVDSEEVGPWSSRRRGSTGPDGVPTRGSFSESTGPTGEREVRPVNAFQESTPFDEMAADLAAHPEPDSAPGDDPVYELSRRLSRLPDPQDLTATVHEVEDEGLGAAINSELGASAFGTSDELAASSPSPPAAVIPIREDTESDPPMTPFSDVAWEEEEAPAPARRGRSGPPALPPRFRERPSSGVAVKPVSQPPALPRFVSAARSRSVIERSAVGPRPTAPVEVDTVNHRGAKVAALEASPTPGLGHAGMISGSSTAPPVSMRSGVGRMPSVAATEGLGPLVSTPSRVGRASLSAPPRVSVVNRPPAVPAVERAPVSTDIEDPSTRRYTGAALLAALGFGLAVGIVVGVAVARYVFVPLVPSPPGVVAPTAEP